MKNTWQRYRRQYLSFVAGASDQTVESKDVNISVRTLVRPTNDYEKLAAALLQHAEYMRRKQEDKESKAA